VIHFVSPRCQNVTNILPEDDPVRDETCASYVLLTNWLLSNKTVDVGVCLIQVRLCKGGAVLFNTMPMTTKLGSGIS